MDLTINRVTLLYLVGVALGIASVFYFGFEILQNLSPTTTAILLFAGFVLFATAGLYVTTPALDTVFYALAAGAYLIFIAYTANKFALTDTDIFLLLAVSSALFISLGYASHHEYLHLTQKHAWYAIIAIMGVSVLLIGIDVLGAQPSYSSEFEDSINVPATRSDVRVGAVTASNEFFFSRTIDPPDYHACLYTPEFTPIPFIRYSDSSPRPPIISGGESRAFTLLIDSSAFYNRLEPKDTLQNVSSVPIEQRHECPDQSAEVKLAIVEGQLRPPR